MDYAIGHTEENTSQAWNNGNNVGTDILDEYVQRLHGRSVEDDLKLAGLCPVTPCVLPGTSYVSWG